MAAAPVSAVIGLAAGSSGNTLNASVAVGGIGGSGNHGGSRRRRPDRRRRHHRAPALTASSRKASAAAAASAGGQIRGRGARRGCGLPVICPSPGGGTNINVAVAVGGNGGTGNDAGTVSVTNHSYITTTGDNSAGILAQSIGGGGGEAGNGSVGLGGGLVPIPIDPSTFLIPISNATPASPKIAIGGSRRELRQRQHRDGHQWRGHHHQRRQCRRHHGAEHRRRGGSGGNAAPGITGLLGIGGSGGSSGSGGE